MNHSHHCISPASFLTAGRGSNLLPAMLLLAASFALPALCADNWRGESLYGAVAGGGSASSVDAGLQMLGEGGNAVDAAVAMLLVLAISDHGMFCMGAEVPFMVYDVGKNEVKVLCGQGVAPLSPDAIAWYLQNGIPLNDPPKMATMPGAISLFFAALKNYGTMSFERVAQPALKLAAGYTPLGTTLRSLIETERSAPGTREQKLQAARDRFYKGDMADIMAEWFRANGGFFTKRDFEEYETRVENPVTYDYRGYRVCKCDTWTQGPALLQTLALLKGFDLRSMGHLSASYIHHCTEALKLAFADRDKYYGDPLFVHVPLDAMLSDAYNSLRRPLIDPQRASQEIRPGDPCRMRALSDPDSLMPWPGGTTTCCVIDRSGNMVAATPSGNGPYSLCEKLGIEFATRLTSFNANPAHPNCIQPGKRPRITLTPTLVLKDGKPVLAMSVAGGDMQDQVMLNLLLNHVEFGMLPAQAVTTPRFYTYHCEYSFNPDPDRKDRIISLGSLTVNATVPSVVQDSLLRMGHRLSATANFIAYPVMVYRDASSGMIYAAGDTAAYRKAGALASPVGMRRSSGFAPGRVNDVRITCSVNAKASLILHNPVRQPVSMRLYSANGVAVATLARGCLPAGTYRFPAATQGTAMPRSVLFVCVNTPGSSMLRRIAFADRSGLPQ